MALTDPELDMLVEMLGEDPGADNFLEVGAELVRRARWAEAETVLAAGLGRRVGTEVGEAWSLLARASLETGHLDEAARAIARADRDPGRSPENARIEILVLERSGKVAEARNAAERFLKIDPDDVIVAAAVERLAAPPPDPARRGADPLYTARRAEDYAAMGRPDRAVRAYRRIQVAHPEDVGIRARLEQLAHEEIRRPDDLSEELTDPGNVPPEPSGPLAMPAPRTGPGST
jgi:tetratricopeptide (TPR) repeat protein